MRAAGPVVVVAAGAVALVVPAGAGADAGAGATADAISSTGPRATADATSSTGPRASAAPGASVGGARYVAGSPAGGADYGTAIAPIDARPIAALLAVAPHRVKAGALPEVRFRVRQRGGRTVRAQLRVYRAATRKSARRLALDVPVGEVAVGHTTRVRWPKAAALRAGRYVVSLHAEDVTGRTLQRSAQRPGQTTLLVVSPPKARPEPPPAPEPPPTPAPAPAPAPVGPPSPSPELHAGVFPVSGGGFSFGGEDARFGAGRKGHVHEGQDVAAPRGTPVVAPVAGTVAAVDYQRGGAGHYVVLAGADGRDYFLCHFMAGSTVVAVGQAVAAGALLARVGSTGSASGPHLHFEIWEGSWRRGRPIDPLPQLQAWAEGAR